MYQNPIWDLLVTPLYCNFRHLEHLFLLNLSLTYFQILFSLRKVSILLQIQLDCKHLDQEQIKYFLVHIYRLKFYILGLLQPSMQYRMSLDLEHRYYHLVVSW